MVTPITVVSALWVLWVLSWFLAARWSGATVLRQSRRDRLLHSVFMWAGTFMLFFLPAALGPLDTPIFPASVALAWGAVALALLGLGWTWWARIHLGRLWSSAVTLKADHTLVRSGPYQITRHPIYTGLLAAFVATALVRDVVAAALGLVLLIVGLGLKVRQEEQLLSDHFGTAYHQYQAQVSALLPGIW
jgi:protein-S-isoprenylcysteine O-methyltransferase Ste14